MTKLLVRIRTASVYVGFFILIGFRVGLGFRAWVFPRMVGTLLGVPVVRSIAFWGLCWGSLILGNYLLVRNKHVYRHAFLCEQCMLASMCNSFMFYVFNFASARRTTVHVINTAMGNPQP